MIKTVVKLLIAALIANAVWRVGTAYMTHFKFQDGAVEIAQFGATKSEDELKQKEMAGPLGGVYSAQNDFQTKLAALIETYQAECDRVQREST